MTDMDKQHQPLQPRLSLNLSDLNVRREASPAVIVYYTSVLTTAACYASGIIITLALDVTGIKLLTCIC